MFDRDAHPDRNQASLEIASLPCKCPFSEGIAVQVLYCDQPCVPYARGIKP